MNWAGFALSVSGALLVAWLVVLARSPRSFVSIYVSFAFLLLAAMNAAAPIRGYVDPNYVGYGLGLLQAQRGILVTLMAGSVFLAAVTCAFIAARNRQGPAMWVVAVVSATFAIIQGWPWLEGVITDPGSNKIQFGEYLTIPGSVGTVLLGALLVFPFALAPWWAAGRAREKPRVSALRNRAVIK